MRGANRLPLLFVLVQMLARTLSYMVRSMPPGKTLKRLDGFLRGHGPTYACGLALSAGLTWAVTGPLRTGAHGMYLDQADFLY